MNFISLINAWPHFLHHIILKLDESAIIIVSLAQTNKIINQYIRTKFRAYHLLCNLHSNLIDSSILTDTQYFYDNIYDRRIFYKFYKLYFPKICIDIASMSNYIVILNWWFDEKKCNADLHFDYTMQAINMASANNYIQILDAWFNFSKETNNKIKLKYSAVAVDHASINNHITTLDWWLDKFLHYGLKFKYTVDAIDGAARFGYINVLNWWLNHKSYIRPKYSIDALDYASILSKIEVLDWFLNSGLTLKYSSYAMDHATRPIILEWWLDLHKKHGYTLEYTEYAMNHASLTANIDVLNWWYNSGLPLDYSACSLETQHNILEWWINSGLPLEYSENLLITAVLSNDTERLKYIIELMQKSIFVFDISNKIRNSLLFNDKISQDTYEILLKAYYDGLLGKVNLNLTAAAYESE